jgi:hypothetical protein
MREVFGILTVAGTFMTGDLFFLQLPIFFTQPYCVRMNLVHLPISLCLYMIAELSLFIS